MNYVFLMDPLETVKVDKDTTFTLMLEAKSRGNHIFFLPEGGILFKENQLVFNLNEVTPQKDPDNPFVDHKPQTLSQEDVDVLFIRNDPPFDQQYLMNTWLLDLASDVIPMINHPNGIRTVNEKIWMTRFSSSIPRTLISRNKSDILEFIVKEKNVVCKPTDGYGGQSIFQVRQKDLNRNVIVETLTHNFTREIIVQAFVEDSRKGDKRILLLNGKPLGAVLRIHSDEDHRNNFFSGGRATLSQITNRDHEIIDLIKPELKQLGLHFVGIDLLGDYLTEINVTSPTCLQEINRLNNVKLEEEVIDFTEDLIKRKKKY